MPANDTIPLGLCQCGCGRKTSIATHDELKHGHVKGQPFHFLRGHNHRNRPLPHNYVVDSESGCHVWQGETTKQGYGRLQWRGRRLLAHVAFYEERHGPIPDGYEAHHRCRCRSCVNADHVEAMPTSAHRQMHAATKLTFEQAEEIRALRGKMRTKDIAARFGIGRSYVWQIQRGHIWRDKDH